LVLAGSWPGHVHLSKARELAEVGRQNRCWRAAARGMIELKSGAIETGHFVGIAATGIRWLRAPSRA
jgi:hypothetical protein